MYNNEKIGVGLITYNRKNSFLQILNKVKSCSYIDEIIVVKNKNIDYGNIDYKNIKYINILDDVGVGACKNIALKYLHKNQCCHYFLIEDDNLIIDNDVFKKYIDTAKIFNLGHLIFGNIFDGITKKFLLPKFSIELNNSAIDIYDRLNGGFCYFSKEVIENVELFDENFINCLEHIEHTYRISKARFYTPFFWFADIHNSNKYLKHSDDGKISTITGINNEYLNLKNAMEYFIKKYGYPINMIHH